MQPKVKPRLFLIFGVVLIIALIPLISLISRNPSPASAAWWDGNWQYRKVIPISSHTSAETNEYIAITGYDASDTTKYQSDCGDVRFTKYNGELLPYTVATCGATTTFNVLFDTFPAGAQDIYIYYGNANAPNGFETTAFSTEASSYALGTLGSEAATPGPVAWWKFDEGQGTTIYDNTTHQNNAAMTGGTWQSDSQCVMGKCMFFDGSDDVATVTNANPLDFDVGLKTGVTFSGWVRVNSDGEGSVGEILDKGTTTYIRVTNDSSNLADLEVSLDLATTDATKTITDGITLNKWHHVAVGYTDDSDDEITVYIDGASKGSSTDGSGAPASTDTNNLLWGGSSAANFHGFIDEAKVYPFERSAAEVKADYTSGTATLGTPDQKDFLSDGLVGYWKLDESSGNAADSSGNSLTLTNNATTTYVAGKFGNGSEHVPASLQYLNTSTTIAGVKTVSFWVNPDVTGNYYIDLDGGTNYISDSAGTLSATGFTSPTIYVNGIVSSTVTANTWQLVTVTTNTAISASAFAVGKIGSNYFDGTMDDVRLYNRSLSASEVRSLYNWAPGPVGYWKLDEGVWDGSSGEVLDSSSTGNNCTRSGGAILINGKLGNAGNFDGVNGDLSCGGTTSLDVTTGGFTLAMWYKSTTTTVGLRVLGKVNTSSSGQPAQYHIYTFTDGKLNLKVADGTYEANATSSIVTNDGTWHHIAATWDGPTQKIHMYVDGVQRETTSAGGTLGSLSNAGSFKMGTVGTETNYFPGSLDDVKIYNYARSSQQIVEDMQGGAPTGAPNAGRTGSQTAYWSFDEQQGSTANNRISASPTITGSISGATWKTKENCRLNGCLDYDGTDDVTTVTNADAIDLNVNLASGFTASAWIYADTDGENDVGEIFQKGTTTYCRTDNQSGSNLDIQCSLDLATTDATLNISSAITTGSWNHIVVGYTDER